MSISITHRKVSLIEDDPTADIKKSDWNDTHIFSISASDIDVLTHATHDVLDHTGLTGIPTTLPASDVYSWAKAPTKPVYTASEIGLGNVPNLSFSGSNTGDQDLSNLVVKVTGSSLVPDSSIANIHAPHSDDQDLSGLVTKTTTINSHPLSGNITISASDLSLATVASTGSYTDLANKPTIPTVLPTPNNITFTTTGGATAGTTFDGSVAKTIDYSTVGASPIGHTHSYQAADADLLAIGGLTGTTGYLKKTAADTWTLDTNTFESSGAVTTHESSYSHANIAHSNRTALDAVSGTNTGDNAVNNSSATAAQGSLADTALQPALPSGDIFVGNASNVATGVAVSGDATLSNNGVLAVNKTRLNVRNETGSTIASTKAVYVSGFNNFPLISLATNTAEVSHNVIGLTVAPIATGSNGYIATTGQCDAETNGWTVGTELYLSTAGALTSTPPTSGAVCHVAIVTVQGNYPTGKLLIYHFPEENYLAGGAGVDTIVRMGDSSGTNKVSFRKYDNTEIGSLDSNGLLTVPAVKITTGAGASKVLTSDASGNGTWATPTGGSSTLTIDGKTGAYTVVAGDAGKIINCTSGTFTVALTAAATLGAGFNCWVWNTGTGAITIDPSTSETIDGKTTRVLRRGEGTQVVCTGSAFQSAAPKQQFLYAETYDPTIGARPAANSSQGAIAMHYDASATGNVSMAFGFSSVASGEGTLALGYRAWASPANSTAVGSNSAYQGATTATGAGAMALGGSYASGTDSFAAAITNNTNSYGATGANAVALGYQSKSSGSGAVCVSGFGAVASGDNSAVLGGYNNLASAANSVSIGGAYGYAEQIGKVVFGGGNPSLIRLQSGLMVLQKTTTDATPIAVTSNAGTAAANNQVILPNSSAYNFRCQVVAMQKGSEGIGCAGYTFTGVIRRGANAAATSLLASAKVVDYESDAAWDCAVTSDITNGGLAVTVTGAAATNIRWVATIWTSELTYA